MQYVLVTFTVVTLHERGTLRCLQIDSLVGRLAMGFNIENNTTIPLSSAAHYIAEQEIYSVQLKQLDKKLISIRDRASQTRPWIQILYKLEYDFASPYRRQQQFRGLKCVI